MQIHVPDVAFAFKAALHPGEEGKEGGGNGAGPRGYADHLNWLSVGNERAKSPKTGREGRGRGDLSSADAARPGVR